MSGGSYDYLCYADFTPNIDPSTLDRMAQRLNELGYPEEAELTRIVKRDYCEGDVIEHNFPNLRYVWREVEWLDSCDIGEDTMHARMANFRGTTEKA